MFFDLQKGVSMKSLADVKVGESATIVKLHGEGALRRHLMDLGLIKGTPFKVVKVARAPPSSSSMVKVRCVVTSWIWALSRARRSRS